MSKNLFKNRSFLFVWVGMTISELGGAFGTFCNSILIYQLTGSEWALGSMWLLYFIPSLILQLFIGPFIDKWSRKLIMIISQWMRGILFLLPLVALLIGELEPWHIFVVQIGIGFITPFYVPANQAITPTIVTNEQLKTANAYQDGTVRLMMFVAPVLGGVMIEITGVKHTLLTVCILLLTSGFLLLFVKETRNSENDRKTWLEQFLEGMSYFFGQPVLVWLGIFLAFVQFGVGVTMVINLPYITGELEGSYAQYGYFMAGFPFGYVIGTMLVGKFKDHNRRVLMLGSLGVGGLTFISLGFNQFILFAIITEIIAGISMAIFNVHNNVICQQMVPNHLMGKVFSVRLLIIRGAMPLGILVGGFLSEFLGVRPLFLFIGIIICIVALAGIILPFFRFLDVTLDQEKSISS